MTRQRTDLYHVPRDCGGSTLAAALRQWRGGESWSTIRQWIAGRRVMVDGNLCQDAARRLRGGEVIKLLEHAVSAPPRADDVKIRFLDAHLAVVEKPAGMTTMRHPDERFWSARRRQAQPTLDELLPQLIAKVEAAQGRRRRLPVRAVHRLDRDTSGLLVFARTVRAERELGQQFRAHELDRVYLAVAAGDVAARTIDLPLVADRGDGRRGASDDPAHGKPAITHVRPLERFAECTLVECRLETGRTHQIRIHLSESGHPVCGDRVYRGPRSDAPLVDRSGAPRLALHAAELGFIHPMTGRRLDFNMPWPSDLAQFVARLRRAQQDRSQGSSPL